MCDCDQALEWISAALDGALTPEEQRRLDAHLAACAECRALAKELRQLQREMPGEAEVPAGFHQAVMDRIAAEQVVPFPPKKRENRTWRSWAALAAVFAVVAVGGGMGRAPGYFAGGGSGNSTAAAPQAAAGASPSAYADVSEDERQAERQPFTIMEGAMVGPGRRARRSAPPPLPSRPRRRAWRRTALGAAGGDLPSSTARRRAPARTAWSRRRWTTAGLGWRLLTWSGRTRWTRNRRQWTPSTRRSWRT